VQHPTESTPDDGADVVNESDVAEAFEVGAAIERERSMRETRAILERIADRLDNAHMHERTAYANGFADALDGREPEYAAPSADKHSAVRWSDGLGGHDVRCSCGWRTKRRRTDAAAVAEWREHAGQPEARPDLHPTWCEELWESTSCDVHVTTVGSVHIKDDVYLIVNLRDVGPDRGLVVDIQTFTSGSGVESTRIDVPVLLPEEEAPKRRRVQHALSVERTQGDHFVWTCRCGWVHVQDPRDVDTQQTLMAHATGAQR
jgi:hypothetical protein